MEGARVFDQRLDSWVCADVLSPLALIVHGVKVLESILRGSEITDCWREKRG